MYVPGARPDVHISCTRAYLHASCPRTFVRATPLRPPSCSALRANPSCLQGTRAPFCTNLLYMPLVRASRTCLSSRSLLTGASCEQMLRAELRAKTIAEPRTQSRGGRPGGAATDLIGLRPKGLYYKPALISPAPMRAPLRKAWDAGKSRCAQFTAQPVIFYNYLL